MKSYSEFKEYVKENVLDYMPAKFENTQISIHQVVKNNDVVLDGLNIHNPDSNISPNIYLNPLYEQYQNGKDLDEIVSRVADIYIENIEPVIDRAFEVKVEDFKNFEKIKDHIFPRVANLEQNSKRLENIPYTQKEDLAITYHIQVTNDSEGIGSVTITDYLMGEYGVSVEELHKQAMDNVEKISPTIITSLKEIMVEMMAGDIAIDEGLSEEEAKEYARDMMPDDGPKLYCVTNESKINGAANMFNENVQKMVADKLGGDYFILPSSVHEVLVLSKHEEIEPEELQSMVRSVNANCLSSEDFLSNQIYQYDAKEHKLSICGPERERKQEHGVEKMMNPAMVVMEESKQYETKQPEQTHEPMKHGSRGR